MGYKIIKLPWPPLRKNLCTPLMALCPPGFALLINTSSEKPFNFTM